MSSTVALVKAGEDLVASVDEALRGCGMADCVSRGDRVLVKPNMHGGSGFTRPEMMAAVCNWAREQGAREVILGDGPYWGLQDVSAYFEETGLHRACEQSGAVPYNMHAHEYIVHQLDSPLAPKTLGVSSILSECDVVINLPIIKTHFNTRITIALKNVKGCVRPMDKKALHEYDLNFALAVVNELIQPLVTVTICDGLEGREGMGPSASTSFPLGLILASPDPVALDTICCELMQIDPASVRLIGECAKRGLGESDLQQISVVGEAVADHARRFKLPHEALAEQFPGFTVHSMKACSCCSQKVFEALEKLEREGRELTCSSLLIGPGPETEADLLVGKCAALGRDCKPDIAGCPPSVDRIMEALTAPRS